MPAHARAGAVIYAVDLERVSTFYQHVVAMTVLQRDSDHHLLESPDTGLVIHAIPPDIAGTFGIGSPPEARDEAAVKLFFTVESLAQAAVTAGRFGGRMLDREWRGPGFLARDGLDPEGNVFQLREPASRRAR